MESASNLELNEAINNEQLVQDAYVRDEPARQALQKSEIVPINLEVARAVSKVLRLLPKLLGLRDQLAQLPFFDMSQVDLLETHALALIKANSLFTTSTRPPDNLRTIAHETKEMREKFYSLCKTMILWDFLDSNALNGYKGTNGYHTTATDLEKLCSILDKNWSRFDGKWPVTQEDLARASRVALHLLRLVGLRENAPKSVAEAIENRDRAFTLFIRSYTEIQRAVTYLRSHEGDANEFAPSLYAFHTSKRCGPKETQSQEP